MDLQIRYEPCDTLDASICDIQCILIEGIMTSGDLELIVGHSNSVVLILKRAAQDRMQWKRIIGRPLPEG